MKSQRSLRGVFLGSSASEVLAQVEERGGVKGEMVLIIGGLTKQQARKGLIQYDFTIKHNLSSNGSIQRQRTPIDRRTLRCGKSRAGAGNRPTDSCNAPSLAAERVWKPRKTRLVRGVGGEAMRWLIDAGKAINSQPLLEVANAEHVELFEGRADVLWIGARTRESIFTCRKLQKR